MENIHDNAKKIFNKNYDSEFLLRKLIGSSYDGITITDPAGRTIWYNDSFLRMSGLLPSQLDNYTIFEIVEKGWLKDSASMESITKNVTVTKSVTYPTGVEALISATPIFDDEGKLLYTLGNVRDLTELNNLKHQLDETTALTEGYRQTLQEVQLTSVDGNQIIYRSTIMEKIISLAHKFSVVDTPILILGESGVGKDVLANYIHFISDRKDKGPFVKINCGAIPEHLLESELFGYEAGSFTGAGRQGKVGLFEVAHNGTIFLDEVGEMPLSLQVKLLGVLQDMKIQRVGGTKQIPIDVRIIAATNANLEKMINEKQFRSDLYFRLNVLSLNIPPLRERQEDVFVLLIHFLKMFNRKHNMNRSFSSSTIDLLLSYQWPGNIRELKNAVEQLIVISDTDIVDDSMVPTNIRNARTEVQDIKAEFIPSAVPELTLKEMTGQYEKKVLAYFLENYRPMKRCADALGIDYTTLARKKKRYKL
ncbi:sigma-54 interaction domain-containing protein [Metabacillus arenae]|uniref:HTH-type transcriptional regulatory protein TyrR n=1 Tax=Metabacillus arenae TaxID=2771434 RepID=A0A926NFA4_9BACI|nr:sigma 54-interacting transcriptional regulator [Metabacillus arenae]MBD1378938.1 sigma 54-interacting transcriptional regulator [Metabacillus arenae]